MTPSSWVFFFFFSAHAGRKKKNKSRHQFWMNPISRFSFYFPGICCPCPPTWPICVAGLVTGTPCGCLNPPQSLCGSHKHFSARWRRISPWNRFRSNHGHIQNSSLILIPPHTHIHTQTHMYIYCFRICFTNLPCCGTRHWIWVMTVYLVILWFCTAASE